MYRPASASRRSAMSHRSFVAFLLVASFGILFAGCGAEPETPSEVFRFTEDDVARFRQLARDAQQDLTGVQGTGGLVPRLDGFDEEGTDSGGEEDMPVLDLSNVQRYTQVRQGPSATGDNLYRVTNQFLNVRSAPQVTAEMLVRLDGGDMVKLVDFTDAAWAKVRLVDGTEGYVSTRYIAKVVPEHRMAEEKQAFEGMYFVDFGFLNVRGAPDVNSDKIGELPGQMIVRPLHIDDVWARIAFEGGEGYVAAEYLSPFLPRLVVRQEQYTLPILHYRLTQEEMLSAMGSHIDRLKQEGYTIRSFRAFRDLVLAQEERDIRLEPRTVLLAVSDVTPQSLGPVTDALLSNGVVATVFLRTQDLGLSGITDTDVRRLVANNFDVQSATHMGDDLRSLTNAQLELELKQSRQLLEERTGQDVYAVAYPWGGVNDRVIQMAAEAGYLFGLGASPQRTFARDDFLQLPGFLPSASMTGDDVLAFVRGE